MLFVIIVIGAFLRFFNLMWGDGNFFHPDEGNMARSISQMRIEKGLNPEFFAYGQFPLYLSYFLMQVLYQAARAFTQTASINWFSFVEVVYKDAVFGLRLFAALFSTLTIAFVYLIVYEITRKDHQNNQKTLFNHLFSLSAKGNFYPLIAAIITAVLPGLIQSAHFGTTESLLTFIFTLVIYLSLRILRTKSKIFWYLIAIGSVIGLGMGAKITAIAFFIPPFFALLFSNFPMSVPRIRQIIERIGSFLLIVITSGAFFFISSPYSIIAWENFHGTSQYESEVALGHAQVFYTRQFIETTPFLFQLKHVFPSVLGLGLTIVGFASLLALPMLISKKRSSLLRRQYLVITASFLFFLVPNSILFVKWTRFLTPVFPLIVVLTTLAFYLIESYIKHPRFVRIILAMLTFTTIVSGLTFSSLYMREDVRTTASRWIYNNIPKGSYILSETGNVVDIPLHIDQDKGLEPLHVGIFNYTVISFDFYNLDDNVKIQNDLIDQLVKSNYIFIPSRRIFSNHMRMSNQFPITNRYYQALIDGRLGFEPVSIIRSGKIIDCTNNSEQNTCNGLRFVGDEAAEETWTVFDHPVVRIYKKTREYGQSHYRNVLNN